MKKQALLVAGLLLAIPVEFAAAADLGDFLKRLRGAGSEPLAESALPGEEDITAGLKEALAQGATTAVRQLGRPDGYLGNLDVKIPVPESLRTVDNSLRRLGLGSTVDRFVESMNHAAEAAVPEAAEILGDAIRTMSIEDARGILEGGDEAATAFFRRSSEARLRERFLPIVSQATDTAGVTARYKELSGNLGLLAGLVDTSSLDLDAYVTDKALDGLFFMIASEERKIRSDPLARSSELLRRVFR